jgi:RNA polymerase sigma-70 factor, ECF subfamily
VNPAPLPTPSFDASQLRKAQQGDPAARKALVAALGPTVWALCRRLDGQPEDAYQDAWAHILSVIVRFEVAGSATLRTWVSRVVHRRLVDRHRRTKVRHIVEPWDPTDMAIFTGRTDPEAEFVDRRRRQKLEVALARLPDAQRRVVVMHHLQGRELTDIAETEGAALGTIKSRLHRGRAQLAQTLSKTLVDDRRSQ